MFYSIMAVVHVLAGAVWLGAMVYSYFLLHPRAHAYFRTETEFESFITFVSHGARWKVLSGLGIIAATGVGLLWLRWPVPFSGPWLLLIGTKILLFLTAGMLFWYVSWRLWPARVFAAPEEIPSFQKGFARVARMIIALALLSMTLGILAHTW